MKSHIYVYFSIVNLKSKLHLIDIGSLSNTKLTQMKLAQSLLAVIHGQKQNILNNDSKLLYVMRELMSSSAQCRISMIAHIQNAYDHLSENIQIVQLSAKIQKSARKLRQRFYKVIILLLVKKNNRVFFFYIYLLLY